MLEIEPAGQHRPTVTNSGVNSNEDFAETIRYAQRTAIDGAYRFAARYLVGLYVGLV